ncbi:MAG: histidinol dehydrogenase, partial [Lachnospiraceae bacterium]|nr:histidinol dehydrogenase [Lachnospiraceae bacterium]
MIRILKAGEVSNEESLSRMVTSADVSSVVAAIIADLRARGDEALKDLTERFDKVRPDCHAVSEAEIAEAFAAVG